MSSEGNPHTLKDELSTLSSRIEKMRFAAVKSRNRHRELDSLFVNLSKEVRSYADKIGALQSVSDMNMALFESLIDLYDRKHVMIAKDCPKNIAEFAADLFGSMRSLIAAYDKAKEATVAEKVASAPN